MKIVKWYYSLHPVVKALISSLLAAMGFFASAILPNEIVNTVQGLKSYPKFFVYLGVFLIIFVCYAIIFVVFKNEMKKIETEKEEENKLTLLAYSKCDKIITDEMTVYSGDCSIENLLYEDSIKSIRRIVSAVFETFDDYYGNSVNPNDRIKFEATFMTKSYIDGEITIPASQNKENRTPISLQLRKDNKHFYDNTITAVIYREQKPTIHIIEDTSDPRSEYEDLYPNQRNRIQSSIVFPILSSQSILLGTLVVHCDKKKFFTHDKKKFWTELLEIFAKRLAYEKTYLDKLVQNADINTIDISEIKNVF